MAFSDGIDTTLQCGYSGCHAMRATKLNGELHRFCNSHRRRQNQHQRDSVARQRLGERRRASRRRVRIQSTADVWMQMELEGVFDFIQADEDASTEAMLEELHALLLADQDAQLPVGELAFLPIENVDDILDLLPPYHP